MKMPGADGKMKDMQFKGMGIEGYDNVKKKFVGSWIDNMGTGIMMSEGTYDPATKTFTYTTDEEMMPGMKTKIRELVVRSSIRTITRWNGMRTAAPAKQRPWRLITLGKNSDNYVPLTLARHAVASRRAVPLLKEDGQGGRSAPPERSSAGRTSRFFKCNSARCRSLRRPAAGFLFSSPAARSGSCSAGVR